MNRATLLALAVLLPIGISRALETPAPSQSAAASDLPETCYLFTYFLGNGESGLHLAWSRDGLKWEALNSGQSFLTPKVGKSRLMRDPCPVQGPDGTFHMVWTDSWDSRTIGYASTKDFIHWSEQKVIPVMEHEPTAKNCWAPEIVYDAKRERFMILWATTIPEKFTETWFDGKNNHNHRMYFTTTKDFETFTPAELFFDPGFNVIDATLFQREGRSYMIYKDETVHPRPRKNLGLALADDLAAPYTVLPEPVTTPGLWVEGPSTLQIGDYVYVYYDAYRKGYYGALRSRDLKTWEDVTRQLSMPRGIRHGTALAVSSDVVKRLLDRDEAAARQTPGHAPGSANPILPGYFADPSLVEHDGKYYLYATLDPWGGETLGCWESTDFKNWTYRVLNWPTKQACTSPTSKGAMVWAPSVIQGRDNRFHIYVSVGSEIWAGVAEHPLGPWRNALGDRPLIPENFRPGFHMIDAEAFIDDDGRAYLYWGSGWEWKNGRCWAVELKPDMLTFDGEVRDVTPTNFFEAPFMVKHNGRYYLMYSQGKTVDDTYRVHYAIGETPLGPFTEASNSPILVTDRAANVLGPGHHAVFRKDGRHYILYHRHSIPFDHGFVGRQICVDELRFTDDGLMAKIIPTHTGPAFGQGRTNPARNLAASAKASASSRKDWFTVPERVLDDNYATRWAAAPDARGGWIQLDLGDAKQIRRQELRPEYAWKPYRFTVQFSHDGLQWQTHADFTSTPAAGSPIVIEKGFKARYVRLVFPEDVRGMDISLFEWRVE